MDQNYASHEEEPPFENENNKLPKIPISTIPIVPTTYNLCNTLFKKSGLTRKGYNIYTISQTIYGYKINQASEKFASNPPKKHDRKQLKIPHRTNVNLFFSCTCI